MSEATTNADERPTGGTVGTRLRTARESQGISVDEVSQTLKFNPKQVEAMERDEFGVLRDPVIMRGFVRNYARFLNLDTEALMRQLERQVGPLHTELTPAPSLEVPATSSRPQMIMPMAVLGILAILGGIFALNKFAPDVIRKQQPQPKLQGTVVPNTPPPAERVAAPPPAPREEPGMPPPGQTPADATAGAAGTAAGAAGASAAGQSAHAGATPPGPGAQAAGVTAPAAAGPGLKFVFDQECWVQVKDAAGKVVHQELHKPGTEATVEIQQPFSMTVGNATGAKVSLDGQPFDLVPYTKGTVARVKLTP